jgi:hypothetical protein
MKVYMQPHLPAGMTKGAIFRENEYAWEISAFPEALREAAALGYACLGGQFWFLLCDGSVYEFYWLEADSSERAANEPWCEYVKRSCDEVWSRFEKLRSETDFNEEAKEFHSLKSVAPNDKVKLLFNAYFVTEKELSALEP